MPTAPRTHGQRMADRRGRWAERAYDQQRGTAGERGYGHTWRKLRRMILSRDPVCRICADAPAVEVDHVLPLRRGGENAEHNLQGVCRACHNRKTRRE